MNLNDDAETERKKTLFDILAITYGWDKVPITQRNPTQRQRYSKSVDVCNTDGDGISKAGTTTATPLMRLDCWPTTSTIGSYLLHPQQGKTQLFRRQCTDDETRSVFANPRQHIGTGYHQKKKANRNSRKNANEDEKEYDNNGDNAGRKRRHEISDEEGNNRNKTTNDTENDMHPRSTKRRRVACTQGQQCRDWDCPYSHPPKCFHARHCWFQPNCWFDHTHGLCKFGSECRREDCWFSHRNPKFYY